MPLGAVNDELFAEIAAILILSALAGLLATKLRQPLVIAFVAVGVVLGPSVLGLVDPDEELGLLAELGVAVLLFVVGLKLDLRVVRKLGTVAVVAGGVQVAAVAAGGFLIALALGSGVTAAIYVGVAVAISSTIIVVKLLSDARELESLYGRLAVGILIVQDLVVVVVLIAVATTGDASDSLAASAAKVILGSATLLVVIAVLMRSVLEPLLHALAASSELLLLFAIAWAVSLAAVGELVGIGTEVGAFLAGFSLASTPYREAIGSRLVSVRDFLLLFFFIELGSRFDLGDARDELGRALVLSAFVLVAKPLVTAAILVKLRYRARVSLRTGITLAQISEFSLILAALGVSVGQIDEETSTLLTAIALVTIAVSSYLFLNSEPIGKRLSPVLERLEHRRPGRGEQDDLRSPPDVVVLGLGRFGHRVTRALYERGVDVLAVDFDPVALSRWDDLPVNTLYGDVEDPELPSIVPLPHDGWVVSTIRHTDANLALLHALRSHGFRGKVAVAAHHDEDATRLDQGGADVVLLPYASAADEVAALVAPSR